jgi:deoxyribodipyrimidine photolyase-related protein
MVTGEETMWHAMLSPYLNIGLLQPLEVIQADQKAYYQNQLPLNSVEGFIDQKKCNFHHVSAEKSLFS